MRIWEWWPLLLSLCCLVWSLNAFQNYKENIYRHFFLLLSSSFPFRVSREWTLFVLIYNCGILRNVQRDVFHISPQKSMPVLVFSKCGIRYVSGCLERFVSRTYEHCIGGQQICFPVEFKCCGSEKENFGYTAPSSKLVVAWFLFVWRCSPTPAMSYYVK